MAGVKTGAINSILFPQDVVANIARIASDIKTIFPLAEGHFVVGPMGKIGWGTPTLISLELGVILDIPRPLFAIIGVLRCLLPAEDAALLELQVNFAGGVDFGRGLIWFNASLFDCRLLAFTLEGDMAVRIGWGERRCSSLTVGGFHPAFREVPDDLRNMTRLTISLLSGDNPRITVQTYFAVTSNTVQSGARVELYAAACGFNVYGFLGYDLLVQFNPFQFIADLYAGLALRSGTSTYRRRLAPRPARRGRRRGTRAARRPSRSCSSRSRSASTRRGATTRRPSGGDRGRHGADDDGARRTTATGRIEVPANSTTGVSVRDPNLAGGAIVIQPFAVLAVSQKVAPLGYPARKVRQQEARPRTVRRHDAADGIEAAREEFAIANFKKLSDSDKLSAKSFEKMRAACASRPVTPRRPGPGPSSRSTTSCAMSIARSGSIDLRRPVQAARTRSSRCSPEARRPPRMRSRRPRPARIKPATIDVADAGFLVVAVSDLNPAGRRSP